MSKIIVDISGLKFGKLFVIKDVGRNRHGGILWLCKCECGTEKIICGDNIKNGGTKSCGCYNSDLTTKRNSKHGYNIRGKVKPEYTVWNNLIARCYNPNDHRYNTYGARGITVCERWRTSFLNFITDVGNRPTTKHSFDRVNNNGNYEPSNCRWTTIDIQMRNTTRNRFIEHNGKRMILQDWARELKTDSSTLIYMLKKKSFEETYKYYTGPNRIKRRRIANV